MSRQPEQIILVGGPYNGETMTIPGMPRIWWMPGKPKAETRVWDYSSTVDLTPLETFQYRLTLDATGWPARRDDGRLVYELEPRQQASWLEEQQEADMPPPVVGCRIRVDQPDSTARPSWPVTLICNCGATVGTAGDIGELEGLLDGPGAKHRETG